MKTLSDFINEQMITESVCKDIDKLRVGNVLYVHKYGEKAINKLTVAAIAKEQHYGYKGSWHAVVEFQDNNVLKSFEFSFFKSIKDEYSEPNQIISWSNYGNKDFYYIGVDEKIVQKVANDNYRNQLAAHEKVVNDLKEKLAKAEEELAKTMASINDEVTEALKTTEE